MSRFLGINRCASVEAFAPASHASALFFNDYFCASVLRQRCASVRQRLAKSLILLRQRCASVRHTHALYTTYITVPGPTLGWGPAR